jgi:hypothetical protein
MKGGNETEFVIARLDWQETGMVLRFQKLCIEKFGPRFEQDEDFRHQMFDALLIAVKDLE